MMPIAQSYSFSRSQMIQIYTTASTLAVVTGMVIAILYSIRKSLKSSGNLMQASINVSDDDPTHQLTKRY